MSRQHVRDGLDRAREALQAIPADLPREEWVKAGMAAKAAGLGFDDFDAWSATSPNCYDPRAVGDTWRSMKDTGGIGAGTLYRMAQEAGWRESAAPRQHAQRGPVGAAGPHRRQGAGKAPARPAAPGLSAVEVWQRCAPATEAHGYIVEKDGRPDGLRVVPQGDPLTVAGLSMAGALVVPVQPLAGGDPTSLQFIAPPALASTWKAHGRPTKLNLPGAAVSGVFVVGELVPGGLAYVVEGIGQAWACWKATGAASVVCFGWGRVKAVSVELRRADPLARVVLVPDAGMEDSAEAIALEVGAEVAAMPEGSPRNFDANDYARAEGHDALELLLERAQVPTAHQPAAAPWRVVRVDDLAAAEIPPQAWAWRDYIPSGEVTLLGAHGGTGKSTLALMLAAAVALGLPLFGVETASAQVVLYSAEDGANTVRRRLQGIARGLGLDVASIAARLQVLDATDAPELAGPVSDGFDRLGFGLTAAGRFLKAYMAERPGSLLIVDNASDTMGGNENARAEVRTFVRLLAGMVRDTGGAVLLLAHVDKGTSRGDRAGGESYSGSTAWHNSARSRLYLSREKDSGALVLEHQKSNHGPTCEPMRLVWPRDGLPQLDAPATGIVQHIEGQGHARSILRLVHEFTQRGEFVSTATTSRTHAGKLLRREPAFPHRLTDPEVFDVLRSAERRGWVQRVVYAGKDRHQRERWEVTNEGAAAAEIAGFAATAGTARGLPSHRTGEGPAEPAATAVTSPPGGVGGTAPHKVTALVPALAGQPGAATAASVEVAAVLCGSEVPSTCGGGS